MPKTTEETRDGELTLFVPITKVEKSEDGLAVYTYGKATGGEIDLDGQIVDPDFARDGLQKWMRDWANVRQMHSRNMPPAGKGVELSEEPDGQWLKARISEPVAMKLALDGTYQGYSVGIGDARIIRDSKAPNGRVVGGYFAEVSLVDRPANPTCKAAVLKRAPDGVLEETGGVEEMRTAMTALEKVADADVTAAVSADLTKGGADDDDPDDDKPDDAKPDDDEKDEHCAKEASYAQKRIHDALCPCYGWAAVADHYPQLEKDGVSSVLGPTTLQLIYRMLAAECQEDAGTGVEAHDLAEIAKAYSSLATFLASEQMEDNASVGMMLADAHASLHKSFMDANPGGGPALEAPREPGSFRRPWLGSGRQAETAPSGNKTPHNGRSLDPDEFERGYIDDGRQTEEPTGKSARGFTPGESAQAVLDIAGRQDAAATMLAVHDSLAGMYPELCAMGGVGTAGPTVDVGGARKVASDRVIDTRADARHELVDDTQALLSRGVDPDLVKAARAAVREEIGELRTELEKRDDRIVELEETVEKLARQPDPHRAPVRGTGRMLPDDTERERQAAPEPDEGEQRIRHLEETAEKASNPELRLWAAGELIKLRADSATTTN
ncbi:MAG TPA: hypothetical protein VMV41_09790 [Cellulomonadaceae bacterium]|nr:hypothetical protein [Cellulomonadaceae bacterium]